MQTLSTLSLLYLQQPIHTLASEAMQVQSHRGPEVRQISLGATLVDKSLVQPAQLEITLNLLQLHALLALLVLLEQSRQKHQPSVLVSAVKASTALLDRHRQSKSRVGMLVSFVLQEADLLLPCLLDSTLALSSFQLLNEQHPSLALIILACALVVSFTQH